MRTCDYIDRKGFKYKVLLPDDAPDSEAKQGVVIGPPSLEGIKAPLEVRRRLHNELFSRHLLTKNDCLKHRQEVLGAIMHVFRVDIDSIIEEYDGGN